VTAWLAKRAGGIGGLVIGAGIGAPFSAVIVGGSAWRRQSPAFGDGVSSAAAKLGVGWLNTAINMVARLFYHGFARIAARRLAAAVVTSSMARRSAWRLASAAADKLTWRRGGCVGGLGKPVHGLSPGGGGVSAIGWRHIASVIGA
jgi:hypothetical protein